jgi:hypothetical protein
VVEILGDSCRLSAPVKSADGCAVDADCAPSVPCHATACLNVANAQLPDANTVCTEDLVCDSADTNSCGCYQGVCTLLPGPLPDLTGTRISADKPIQVIAGHQCANVPGNVVACDHLEESLFPYETLSTSAFVAAPLIPDATSNPKVQMVRILATQPNTFVQFDPSSVQSSLTLTEAGDFLEIGPLATDFFVSASQPIGSLCGSTEYITFFKSHKTAGINLFVKYCLGLFKAEPRRTFDFKRLPVDRIGKIKNTHLATISIPAGKAIAPGGGVGLPGSNLFSTATPLL